MDPLGLHVTNVRYSIFKELTRDLRELPRKGANREVTALRRSVSMKYFAARQGAVRLGSDGQTLRQLAGLRLRLPTGRKE